MPSGSEDQNRIAAATVLGFPVHPGRAAALGEVHVRPAPLVETPHLLIQLAFMTEGGATVDHAVLADLSRANGVAPPPARSSSVSPLSKRWFCTPPEP